MGPNPRSRAEPDADLTSRGAGELVKRGAVGLPIGRLGSRTLRSREVAEYVSMGAGVPSRVAG